MSTRSTIALEFADGTVKQVYCHNDGYLSNNGAILQESYMDPFKVKRLVELGGMSSLGHEIDPDPRGEHSFDDRQAGVCVFYARDRGQDLHVNKYANRLEYFTDCQQEEYDYFLRNVDGVATWFVGNEGFWVTLEEAFAHERKLDAEFNTVA